jgi:hypothetical protein
MITVGENDLASTKQESGMNSELISELDAVVGGTGSLGDALTYVKAYVAALGTVSTPKLGSIYDGTDMGPNSPKGGSTCPTGCHGIP